MTEFVPYLRTHMNKLLSLRKLALPLSMAMLLAPMAALAGDEDLAVVVSKDSPINNLTKSQLRKLVLGEQESWPSGQKVTVVLNAPGTAERKGVLSLICRMTETDYVKHAIHAKASGEAMAMRILAPSGAAARQIIGNDLGAVGFLRLSEVNDTVKILKVDGVGAGEKDYKLKAVK
jgi:phosphate transport system substrate-binding protein